VFTVIVVKGTHPFVTPFTCSRMSQPLVVGLTDVGGGHSRLCSVQEAILISIMWHHVALVEKAY